MYFKEVMIGMICDNCGETYEESNNGYTAFVDESRCKEEASEDGWFLDGDGEHEGKHYCPKCCKTDDDDNLILNQSRNKPQQP